MAAALKHIAIREYVRDLVATSVPGSPAPSERDLVQRFGVARMTVRHALDTLVNEGVLERFAGRGTFVARPRRGRSRLTGISEDLERRGQVAESRSLSADLCAAPVRVAECLEVVPGSPVIRWRRLRLADGRPLCVTETYLDADLLPGFLEAELPISLYRELLTRDRRPTWAEDAVTAAPASTDQARLLEIGAGEAVLRHTRRAFWNDRAIELSRTVYRGDAHVLSLQLEA
ncbi:MAG: GntR family transcriptional regulator [Nocardioidaceae bacterium]|nr:GntR family transcriptional regulator [Nocardioidaceae bacterium]MCL2612073.1 GntR family transcriptional regulator [Nocardioidaceae bacterium]